MMQLRQLVLRSNRFLGSALVEKGLIDQSALEAANERLIDLLQRGETDRPCLLRLLIYELRVLDEEDLLDSLARGAPIGLVDLTQVSIKLPGGVTPDVCAATGTIPFGQRDKHHFVATTYFMSKPVREYWEEQLTGEIVWFATTLEQMDRALEDLTGRPPPETRPPIPDLGAAEGEVKDS